MNSLHGEFDSKVIDTKLWKVAAAEITRVHSGADSLQTKVSNEREVGGTQFSPTTSPTHLRQLTKSPKTLGQTRRRRKLPMTQGIEAAQEVNSFETRASGCFHGQDSGNFWSINLFLVQHEEKNWVSNMVEKLNEKVFNPSFGEPRMD